MCLGQLDIKVRIVFKTSRVGSYFSLKDRTPLELRANVVYIFEGSCDRNQSYIGKTMRHLAVRSKEHFSGRSAVHDHISKCVACKHCDINNFRILTSGKSDFDSKIKEALLIKQWKPVLNNQLFQKGSSFLLNVF